MHPITVLMLSRTIEDDRRREIERRRHWLIRPEPIDGERNRRRWRLRLPRFSLTITRA